MQENATLLEHQGPLKNRIGKKNHLPWRLTLEKFIRFDSLFTKMHSYCLFERIYGSSEGGQGNRWTFEEKNILMLI